MAYLIPSANWTFRKSGPRTFRKSRPYAKIYYIGQKNFYDKVEVANFKYEIFKKKKNCRLKPPKLVIFGPKVEEF